MPTPLELNWKDEDFTASGFTQNTGGINVTVSNLAQASADYMVDSSGTQYVDTAAGETFASNSSAKIAGDGNDGTPGDEQTSITTIDFSAVNGSGFSNEVENVTFRINDFDTAAFIDVVTVRAYDANGDQISVDLTWNGTSYSGTDVTLTSNTGSLASADEAGSILVEIAGPVSYFEIDYDNDSTGSQQIWITDVHFDAVAQVLDGIVEGSSGNDVIDGSYVQDPDGDKVDSGDEILPGYGPDGDLIEAYGGNDTVLAGAGDDRVYAGTGADSVSGGTGDDTIYGEAGNDTLDGGAGADSLFGGSGNDTFIASDGHDTITDFNTGNTGTLDDGDQTNNDFVDLSGYYNATNLAAYNAANPGATFANPLAWMRADQADDGILNDTDAGWDAGNTLTIQNGGSAVAGDDMTYDNTSVVCFAAGTMIATKNGLVAIEDLSVGDQVMTLDNGFQKLAWISSRKLDAIDLQMNPNLLPIRIEAGALGHNLPKTALTVSPQHRMLVRSIIAKQMFGETEVLIAAKKLLALDGIDIVEDADSVEYFHMLFDRHEIVFANGAPSESLYTGKVALKSLPLEAIKEIMMLFPKLASKDYMPHSARYIPKKGKEMKRLAQRHQRIHKPLLEDNTLAPSKGLFAGSR